jgi:hypothetical protein
MMTNQVAHQLDPQEYMESILKIFTGITIGDRVLLEQASIHSNELADDIADDLLGFENPEIIPITGEGVGRPVVACDTSTIRVADFLGGSIWALRGCIVCRSGSARRAMIYGPIYYILTPANLQPLIRGLYEVLDCRIAGPYPSIQIAPKVIANLFERVLQFQALEYLDGGIMLLDGSLTAGPLDSPAGALARLLRRAGEIGYGVLAFSKSTRLTSMGRRITDLAVGYMPPYLLKPVISQTGYAVIGEVYVANLAPSSFPFRVDVSLADGLPITDIFRDLLSSDSVIYGYPETLALAHQLSTFSRLDIIGLRASLEYLTGTHLAHEFDVRSSLFSPLDG